MKKIAVYPGSFDPVTKGHLDIINRSLDLFDKLIVGVLNNPRKKYWFDSKDRVEMIKIVSPLSDRIEVVDFNGLLVNFMKQYEANVVIRGLRAVSDYEYELQLHLTNKSLAKDDFETIFLPATRDNLYLSSSLVKEVALYGGDVNEFLPEKIVEIVNTKVEKFKGEVR